MSKKFNRNQPISPEAKPVVEEEEVTMVDGQDQAAEEQVDTPVVEATEEQAAVEQAAEAPAEEVVVEPTAEPVVEPAPEDEEAPADAALEEETVVVEANPSKEEKAAKAVDAAVARVSLKPTSKYEGRAHKAALEQLDKLVEEGNEIQKRAFEVISSFAHKTRPRVNHGEGALASEQAKLLRYLVSLIGKDFDTFRQGWSVLLRYFEAHHDIDGLPSGNQPGNFTALSEYRALQEGDFWGDQSARKTYAVLIDLLRMTRDPKTRNARAKSDFNFNVIQDRQLTELHVENLKRFYNLD